MHCHELLLAFNASVKVTNVSTVIMYVAQYYTNSSTLVIVYEQALVSLSECTSDY